MEKKNTKAILPNGHLHRMQKLDNFFSFYHEFLFLPWNKNARCIIQLF